MFRDIFHALLLAGLLVDTSASGLYAQEAPATTAQDTRELIKSIPDKGKSKLLLDLDKEASALSDAIATGNTRLLGLTTADIPPASRLSGAKGSTQTAVTRLASYTVARAAVETNGRISDKDLDKAREAIILNTRLSYIACGGSILDINRVPYWIDDLESFRDKYGKLMKSVGAFEIAIPEIATGDPTTWRWYPFNPNGTAFMFHDNGHALTNYHVVEKYMEETDNKVRIKPRVKLRINFSDEYQSCPRAEKEVTADVLEVQVLPDSDLALLTVSGADLPPPVPLPSRVAAREGQSVVVVGVPLADPRIPRRDQDTVYMGPDGFAPMQIKRVSPGMVLKSEADQPLTFRYDASTLGGNSGSPVFDMSNGTLLGIHYLGIPYDHNEGIVSTVAARLAR